MDSHKQLKILSDQLESLGWNMRVLVEKIERESVAGAFGNSPYKAKKCLDMVSVVSMEIEGFCEAVEDIKVKGWSNNSLAKTM